MSPEGLCFPDLLLQKRVLHSNLRSELLDFLEGAGIDDGGGYVVGENAQPGRGVLRGGDAVELRDNAQDLLLKNNRLPAQSSNPLALRPSTLAHSINVRIRVVGDNGLPGCGNAANHADARLEYAEIPAPPDAPPRPWSSG